MIVKDTFQNVLKKLTFTEAQKGMFSEVRSLRGKSVMRVDSAVDELLYLNLVTIRNITACNFNHHKNFIIFEWEFLLSKKGYRSKHSKLKKYRHYRYSSKADRSDVDSYNEIGQNLLRIIKYQTAHHDYDAALTVSNYYKSVDSENFENVYARNFSKFTKISKVKHTSACKKNTGMQQSEKFEYKFYYLKKLGGIADVLKKNLTTSAQTKSVNVEVIVSKTGFSYYNTVNSKENILAIPTVYEQYKNYYSYPAKGKIPVATINTIDKLTMFDSKFAHCQISSIEWCNTE